MPYACLPRAECTGHTPARRRMRTDCSATLWPGPTRPRLPPCPGASCSPTAACRPSWNRVCGTIPTCRWRTCRQRRPRPRCGKPGFHSYRHLCFLPREESAVMGLHRPGPTALPLRPAGNWTSLARTPMPSGEPVKLLRAAATMPKPYAPS